MSKPPLFERFLSVGIGISNQNSRCFSSQNFFQLNWAPESGDTWEDMCQRVPVVRPPDISKILGGRRRRRRRRSDDFDDFGSFDEEDFFDEEFDDFEAILQEDGEVCG